MTPYKFNNINYLIVGFFCSFAGCISHNSKPPQLLNKSDKYLERRLQARTHPSGIWLEASVLGIYPTHIKDISHSP